MSTLSNILEIGNHIYVKGDYQVQGYSGALNVGSCGVSTFVLAHLPA